MSFSTIETMVLSNSRDWTRGSVYLLQVVFPSKKQPYSQRLSVIYSRLACFSALSLLSFIYRQFTEQKHAQK